MQWRGEEDECLYTCQNEEQLLLPSTPPPYFLDQSQELCISDLISRGSLPSHALLSCPHQASQIDNIMGLFVTPPFALFCLEDLSVEV